MEQEKEVMSKNFFTELFANLGILSKMATKTDVEEPDCNKITDIKKFLIRTFVLYQIYATSEVNIHTDCTKSFILRNLIAVAGLKLNSKDLKDFSLIILKGPLFKYLNDKSGEYGMVTSQICENLLKLNFEDKKEILSRLFQSFIGDNSFRDFQYKGKDNRFNNLQFEEERFKSEKLYNIYYIYCTLRDILQDLKLKYDDESVTNQSMLSLLGNSKTMNSLKQSCRDSLPFISSVTQLIGFHLVNTDMICLIGDNETLNNLKNNLDDLKEPCKKMLDIIMSPRAKEAADRIAEEMADKNFKQVNLVTPSSSVSVLPSSIVFEGCRDFSGILSPLSIEKIAMERKSDEKGGKKDKEKKCDNKASRFVDKNKQSVGGQCSSLGSL